MSGTAMLLGAAAPAARPEAAGGDREALAWDETSAGDDPKPMVGVHSSRPKVPELRLYAAILEDAWLCLTQPRRVSATTHAAAFAWVEGRTSSAPFCSFEEICALLSLDAGAVRDRIRHRGAPADEAADGGGDRSIRTERRSSRTRA